MAYTVISTTTLQWTPPSAAVNSGQSAFTHQAAYNAQNVGAIDVPASTPPSTVFDIPFGSVGKAKCLVVKNLMTTDVDVKLNGSGTVNFTLPPGGKFSYECPVDPTTGTYPLIEASITTLATPTNLESVQYWVFGD